MRIETTTNVFLLLIAGILLSCASSTSIGYLDLANATSRPGLNLHNARLGILPLRSYPKSIGNVISVTLGNELKNTGIEITETAEMIRLLKEQEIIPRTATKASDFSMIARVCNVDYLLVGEAIVTVYTKSYVNTGVVSVDFLQTTAQIVNAYTGDIVLSASVQRPPKEEWNQADIIGEALAFAIMEALARSTQP